VESPHVTVKAQNILETLKNHKGQFAKVEMSATVPTLKSLGDVGEVTKRTIMFVTAGVDFAERKAIREAIESGERGKVGSLPWGQWKQAPFVIEHKGNEYFRFYPPTEAQREHFPLGSEVQFYHNSQPITREQAIALCGSKAEVREHRGEDCFAVNCANIVNVQCGNK